LTSWHPRGLYTDYEYTLATEVILSLMSTALFVLILRLFLLQRLHTALPLAWCYAVLVWLANANCGTGVFFIDWILVSLTKLASPFLILGGSYLGYQDSMLSLGIFSWIKDIHVSPWLGPLSILPGVLNLLIAYYIIRAAMLWPTAKLRVDAAAA